MTTANAKKKYFIFKGKSNDLHLNGSLMIYKKTRN
jgi:hypothetical protein